MMLMLVLTIFSGFTYSQCEPEKEQADRWNKILKSKVSERARNKHRKAKKEFLDCLRQPTEIIPTKSKTKTSKPTKTKYTFSPGKSSSHVTVSDYTDFKGKKKLAWNLYFVESDKCLSNKNDMKIFVACAKVRKQNLKTFNARWNKQTQELMPLLDN
jgi:N-acetylmuramoyl-L-alanine amidase CwlA